MPQSRQHGLIPNGAGGAKGIKDGITVLKGPQNLWTATQNHEKSLDLESENLDPGHTSLSQAGAGDEE